MRDEEGVAARAAACPVERSKLAHSKGCCMGPVLGHTELEDRRLLEWLKHEHDIIVYNKNNTDKLKPVLRVKIKYIISEMVFIYKLKKNHLNEKRQEGQISYILSSEARTGIYCCSNLRYEKLGIIQTCNNCSGDSAWKC